MSGDSGMSADNDCECICNHSGACTGCGICWLKAYYEHLDQAMRALFGMPPIQFGVTEWSDGRQEWWPG